MKYIGINLLEDVQDLYSETGNFFEIKKTEISGDTP